VLSLLDFDIFGIAKLEADEYTSAGYLMAVLSVVTFAIVAIVFVEPNRQEALKIGMLLVVLFQNLFMFSFSNLFLICS
jgi:hypothetical protein